MYYNLFKQSCSMFQLVPEVVRSGHVDHVADNFIILLNNVTSSSPNVEIIVTKSCIHGVTTWDLNSEHCSLDMHGQLTWKKTF